MKTTARLLDDGPLVLGSEITLLDGAGAAYPSAPVIAICRCGLSGKKPFCDGAHRVERFSHKARVPEPKK